MDINSFSISISKDQLLELPTVEFPGAITVVETLPDATKALDILSSQHAVGFDTETKPNFRKGHSNTVSLIQISTLDHSYLFRLNKLGFCEPLKDFLESEAVVKVGLSLKDDFHMLHKVAEFNPQNFVDLQNVVKSFHIADSSLQKIYGILFNGRISKSQRLSNWEASTLSAGQMVYASIDAWACLKIYNYLTSGSFEPQESSYIVTTSDENTDSSET
ncbi:MAG: 3'-5' exonuclease domain-containing protein 2 [Duncaniella sp.]|nr:3'-5' exonuclease domain-containing protein 2 [Muribaculum sp.]MCM1255154.1 3'-5' exonuclease domain-containing protein 2 [Duncaniella sp.]